MKISTSQHSIKYSILPNKHAASLSLFRFFPTYMQSGTYVLNAHKLSQNFLNTQFWMDLSGDLVRFLFNKQV